MSEIILRPYQQKFIDDVRHEFAHGIKHVVGVAPCGAGKTIMTGWMIRQSLQKGKRSIFFVHRDELIAQTAKTFYDLDIPFGIIAAGHEMHTEFPVQIASVQTLARRLDKVPTPDFLICDEAHHILAKTYRQILDAFPNTFLLGVTATPQRMGGIALCDVFDSMVESLPVNELIKIGNLTDCKYFAPDIGVKLDNVRKHFGEFNNDDLARVMGKKKIIGGIVENYRKLAYGKQAICYCVNVAHSKSVAEAFNNARIPAAHVDGDTDKHVRRYLVSQFRQGNIKVLCNAELFGEGFDVPNCQVVILARPTNSLTLHVQQSMRAMRPDPNDPNKVAIIIDHVENYLRHGTPKARREWSLDPNNKPTIQRICQNPKCGHVIIPTITLKGEEQCPICGSIIPPDVPIPKEDGEKNSTLPDIEICDGELKEVDEIIADDNGRIVDGNIKRAPKTPEEFLAVEKKKNYRSGWAAYKSLERAKSYEDCLHIAKVCGYKSGWAYYKWQERETELEQKKQVAKCPPCVLE